MTITEFIKAALNEDLNTINGGDDFTSLATIPLNTNGKAKLIIKEKGILAGISIAIEIFNIVDNTLVVSLLKKDGDVVNVGDIALTVQGSVHSILKAERLVLNTMQRMSGIATVTNMVVKSLEGTSTKVLDTRKTTPNMRMLEKLAVKIGGGENHRVGLYDMILIKDNHVDYAGGISKAIQNAKKYQLDNNLNLPIVIETRNINEVQEVLLIGGVTRIMLDNFSFDKIKEAVTLINKRFPVEASGGITFDNAIDYAKCGVDYISIGALTHSVKSLDMSLKAV